MTPANQAAHEAAIKPVAWMRDAGEESISTMTHCCTDRIKQLWLKANPQQVERYTIPLYGPAVASLADVVISQEKRLRNMKRCTCPATPGEIRKLHEEYCPWAIADALRGAIEQARKAIAIA